MILIDNDLVPHRHQNFIAIIVQLYELERSLQQRQHVDALELIKRPYSQSAIERSRHKLVGLMLQCAHAADLLVVAVESVDLLLEFVELPDVDLASRAGVVEVPVLHVDQQVCDVHFCWH